MAMNRIAGKGRFGERGFTLLELLISIFLILLVAMITVGAMRLGYRSVESGDKRINAQERFRASMNVIESQIQSGIPIGWKEKEEDIEKVYFKGNDGALQFSSNVSIWDGRRGYLTVDYRVEQDANGKKRLMASENTVGMANQRETLLFNAMDDIRFEYFGAGAAEAGSWSSQWTDTMKIPEKIKIHLAYGGKDFSTLIPVRVKQGEVRPITNTGSLSSGTGAPGAK
jgi:prepilin-type N-terminal cleavage/methylation domain-containing protein